jgi:hypothetical protein
MSEQPKNYSSLLLVLGILFVVGSATAIIGFGSLPAQAKEQIINFIKRNKPSKSSQEQHESLKNTQDSMYLEKGDSKKSDLNTASPAQPYDFKMKVDEGAKQQEDAVDDYAFPSVQPGVPGSKEWQNEFWQEK